MPDVTVYLGLGSNLGDREGHLDRGLAALAARGLRLLAVSSIYETEPVGGPAQGPYLNLVASAATALPAETLMQAALEAEGAAGRVRTVRNTPRTLDVDILIYGALVRHTAALTLPHPRPDLTHPALGRTVRELRAAGPDHSRIEVWPGRAVAR